MALGIPLAGWAIATSVAAAGAAAVQGHQQQVAGKNARNRQIDAQQKAESAAASAQRKAGEMENRANQKQPDALALLGQEQLATLRGVGTSSLNSPDAITPRVKLGTKSLLG